jgi:hypothetical protein
MQTKSKIGVCLDYSIAYLLEEKNEEKVITIIESEDDEIIDSIEANDEIPEKRHRKDHIFFKKIFDMVKGFDKVMLFGPASVKNEILKRIKAHKLVNIEVFNNPNQDKVTDNEKFEFINNYFGN